MKLSPEFLEAMNGALFVIFLALLFVFARYIASGIRQHGLRRGLQVRRAAVCMVVLIGGDAMIRGSVWAWRHYEMPVDDPRLVVAVATGVAVCTFGGLCGLRHFSPREWGHWAWSVPLAAALAFGIGMAM